MEGGHGGRDGEGLRGGEELAVEEAEIANGGGFGFVSEREFEKESVGGKKGFLALFDEVIIKGSIVGFEGVADDGVFGLIGLDED